ncbi:hypothetical protein [Microbacterium sp. 77mftsu3.1]|uniref:hypothetical protein n=1 Tax=Microbacterium sp. 77mftsu3.1 TaxID=1761802 RepID=UPI00036408B8|nr:hypothetical protein [Microbacterium sp. 77mftsu3.1]SDH34781.1 hypothetical protein SAMN04488590_3094 [Microbacterium sp. 77mftsu3.1]
MTERPIVHPRTRTARAVALIAASAIAFSAVPTIAHAATPATPATQAAGTAFAVETYGVPLVDRTFTAITRLWPLDALVTYRWFAGTTEVTAFADGKDYRTRDADAGKRLTVAVTVAEPGKRPVTVTSEPTEYITYGTLSFHAPKLVGTMKVGEHLSIEVAGAPAGSSISRTWYANSTVVGTGERLRLTPDHLGKRISARVLVSNRAWLPNERGVKAGSDVAKGNLQAEAPVVAGSATVGKSLSATPRTKMSGMTYAYQWQVDGRDVTGATSATFVPKLNDFGKPVTVKVRHGHPAYVNASYATSAPVAVGQGTLQAEAPTVSGVPAVGKTLTSTARTKVAGMTHSYQWFADGKAIDGATGAKFTPQVAHFTKKITVKVSHRHPGYSNVSTTTSAAVTIGKGTFRPEAPRIEGTAVAGRVLSAKTSQPGGTDLAYQWYSGGKLIKGATAATYKSRDADKGKAVLVDVRYSHKAFQAIVLRSAAVQVR